MAISLGMDNIIAALGQSKRICQVDLSIHANRLSREVLAAMQVPFPELTDLQLGSYLILPVIPDSFLGGSAPRLRHFTLSGIAFPGLPKLLLSATHLVRLDLFGIPHSGYISPETMVAVLSTLSSLETLFLGRSYYSHGRKSPSLPPLKRSILPALRRLHFDTFTKYLEEFVTRIDTPQLDELNIRFYHQIVDFHCPQLAQFINCTLTLRALDEAHVEFDNTVGSTLQFRRLELGPNNFRIHFLCREPHLWLSSVVQVCNSSLHPFFTVEDLYIKRQYSQLIWKAIKNTLWLQLLLPFTAVKNLYLSKELAPGIAAALQESVGDRITEVLPVLQIIFVEALEPSGRFQENIGRFVAARQLSGRPIAISVWDKGSNMKSM